jgi:hypothetical protein
MVYELRLIRIKCHNIPQAVKVYASYGNQVFFQGANRVEIKLVGSKNIILSQPKPTLQYSVSSNLYLFKVGSPSGHLDLALFESSNILSTAISSSSNFPVDHSFNMFLGAPDSTISSGSCTVFCKIFMVSSSVARVGALV